MSISNLKLRQEFEKLFPEIIFEENLGRHSTFQIGGPADFFYVLKETKKLKEILNFLKKINSHRSEGPLPLFVFGSGTNLLFHDNGFRGLVIKMENRELRFEKQKDQEVHVTAGAGVLISKLINETIAQDYMGLEQWTGLPGTVGGAVRGNAGCNGLETKDVLVSAEILNPKTLEIRTKSLDYFEYDYRESRLKRTKEIVLQATFKLKKRDITKEEQIKIMSDIRKFRLTKQPFGCSTGSFFKNPSSEKPAGMLIDQAGLKGTKVGGAMISELHGNFFLNKNKATADDVEKLAQKAEKAVYEKFGIQLEREVYIVPEK